MHYRKERGLHWGTQKSATFLLGVNFCGKLKNWKIGLDDSVELRRETNVAGEYTEEEGWWVNLGVVQSERLESH